MTTQNPAAEAAGGADAAAGANDFSALLGELQALQSGNADLSKALKQDPPEGESKIQAAAADAGVEGVGDGQAGNEAAGDAEGGAAADGETEDHPLFGKALSVTMPDGTVQKAFDGAEAVRLAHARMDRIQAEVVGIGQTLAKALAGLTEAVKGQQGVASEQIALIKSLQGDVARLGGSGSGRRSALTVHPKPTAADGAAAAADAAPEPGDILEKALAAQRGKRLTAVDVARIEGNLQRGVLPDAQTMAILNASARTA